jgi:hypothetical protein
MIGTNLNDFAYHEGVEETPGIEGSLRLRCGNPDDFEAKSCGRVQAKVTLFLLPPDGVC